MSNMYYSPEDHGLRTIGEINWSSGSYEFDLLVVWQRESDGALLWGEDSGWSCPTPFEDIDVDDLTPLLSLSEFQAHLATRDLQLAQAADLLERLHAAGVR